MVAYSHADRRGKMLGAKPSRSRLSRSNIERHKDSGVVNPRAGDGLKMRREAWSRVRGAYSRETHICIHLSCNRLCRRNHGLGSDNASSLSSTPPVYVSSPTKVMPYTSSATCRQHDCVKVAKSGISNVACCHRHKFLSRLPTLHERGACLPLYHIVLSAGGSLRDGGGHSFTVSEPY